MGHEVDKLKDRYIFWQSVAIAKPDYRDAFVTLASLAYQLGKLDESKTLAIESSGSGSQ